VETDASHFADCASWSKTTAEDMALLQSEVRCQVPPGQAEPVEFEAFISMVLNSTDGLTLSGEGASPVACQECRWLCWSCPLARRPCCLLSGDEQVCVGVAERSVWEVTDWLSATFLVSGYGARRGMALNTQGARPSLPRLCMCIAWPVTATLFM